MPQTAPPLDIHASCIRIGAAGEVFGASPDTGVLLLGDSGAGKSDAALQLIAMGAELVADDRTQLFVDENSLWARPTPRGAGLIEVRGIGILSLPFTEKVRIRLVVSMELGERLPSPRRWKHPEVCTTDECAPNWIFLPNSGSVATKIVLAAAAFEHGLHRDDVNTI